MKNLQVIPATLADYPVIQNMGRFYVYDMSEYMGSEAIWIIFLWNDFGAQVNVSAFTFMISALLSNCAKALQIISTATITKDHIKNVII